jgi:glutamyl-tRNA synthetase
MLRVVPASPYRGRFAPSPTGDLHLGSAATALVAWLSARAAVGELVLRIEDLDGPRTLSGMAERQLDDLRWLGLDWDEGPDVGGAAAPYRQSERSEHYDAALARLDAAGLIYACDCSRAEIARVTSAPHPGDEGPRYPGTCRERATGPWKRPPALRLRVPPGMVGVYDALQGRIEQDVAETVGDFVLRRGDGAYAYQLAVVVDDLAMGISEVVRGADLLGSAPRQALLARLLGAAPPAFAHGPLVLAPDGTRLAKRAHGATLRDQRAAGAQPGDVLAALATLLGLEPAASLDELRRTFDRSRLAGVQAVRLPGAGSNVALGPAAR